MPLPAKPRHLLSGGSLAGLILSATAALADLNPGYDAIGPIDVQTRYQRPAVAVYLNLQAGQSFQVQATHEDAAASTYERYDTRLPLAVLRVTDPDEQLIYHRVVDTAVVAADYPELAADDLPGGLLADTELQATRSGVYTVRMSAAYEHSKLWVGVPPGTDYGLHYGNGVWQDWRATQGPLWIWIPRADGRDTTVELRHERGSCTIWGPSDAWSHTLSSGTWTQTVSPGQGGELWRLDGLSADWQLRAGGDVPFITATSASFAQALDASLLPIESGRLAGQRVPHRFQKRIVEELVPALLEQIGDAAELRALVDDALSSDACANPGDIETARRAEGLASRDLPAVTWALDHWRFGDDASTHPFADVEHHFAIAPVMARLYAYHHPCNPWGPTTADGTDGRPELIARAALAAMTHLLDVTEDDRLSTGGDAWSNYPGGTNAFQIGDRAWPFALIAPKLREALPAPLGDDVLAAYTEGLRRLSIDRRYTEAFVTARNQSAFYVPTLGAVALNRDEPRFETIARAYAERFSASADPAGWFPESQGPDATYNGITHAELAHYYVMTAWLPGCSDPNVRQALQTSYAFFNATVAPEPAGGMLGGFNFSHRTNWGFYAEQFSGARNRARDIPEVAIWSDPSTQTLEQWQADVTYAISQFDNRVANTPTSASTLLSRFLTFVAADTYHFPEQHAELTWPALDGQTDQLFDDDLYVVRRNGFYGALYVGHPIHNTFYTDSYVEYMRRATPPSSGCPPLHMATYEDTGVILPSWNEQLCPGDYPGFHGVHPFVGGGLSLVWTPDFGAALLAANWSPLVHHGVVGLRVNPNTGAQERTWERYAATVFHSASRDGAELSGAIPIHYEATDEISYSRQYTFSDDAISVSITLTNDTGAPQSFDALWENLPVPVCSQDCDNNRKGRAIGFAAADGTPLTEGDHSLDAVHIVDAAGHGMAVELAGGPRLLAVRPVGMTLQRYSTQTQIGRLELPFDTTVLAAGASTSLEYQLRTLDPVSSVPPMPTITDEPEVLCGPGAGGSGGGAGGGAAGGAPPGAGAESSDDDGCGCRSAPARFSPLAWFFAVLLAAAAHVRRRASQ